ncbi:ankyrin repeat protein [Fowlpox virus]|nr:ankyrin repeat protein [Fowlpox virus]
MCIQLRELYCSMYKNTDDEIIRIIEHYKGKNYERCNEECTMSEVLEFIEDFELDDDYGSYNMKVFFPIITLHQAIEARRYNVVKYLLDINDQLDTYVDEYTRYHPLHVITAVPRYKDVLIFIEAEDKIGIVKKADIRSDEIGLYKSTFIEVIKEVIHGKTEFTDDELIYLEQKIKNEEYKIASLLISKGANIDAMNRNLYTALRNSVINGSLELTKLLLDNGANKEIIYDNLNIFELSTMSKNIDVVKEIVNRYGCNYRSDNVMYNACKKGCHKVIKYLIDLGFNVNQRCNLGEYPLHAASRAGSLDVVNTLIENNAIIDQESSIGSTPLMLACDNPAIVKSLLDKGANPCTINNLGIVVIEVAMHYTSFSKYLIVSRLILLEHVLPDIKNDIGFIISMNHINENYELRNFMMSCYDELKRLSSTKLNSKYSLDIFVTSNNERLLSKLVNNSAVESITVVSYPIYFELLSKSVNSAKKLRDKIFSFISDIDVQLENTYWRKLPMEIKYRVAYLIEPSYLTRSPE